MASVARYYNLDKVVTEYALKHKSCNLIYLGVGLETAYDRLFEKLSKKVKWYSIDLPKVIETRRKGFGQRENETMISSDIFKMDWTLKNDTHKPSILIICGVFQYFHEEEIVNFIKNCKDCFESAEMIFDATSKSGLKFTNYFIKKTGNNALMYFYVNDSQKFAKKCNVSLISEIPFFNDALKLLKGKLNMVTTISMKVADKKRQTKFVYLSLSN